MVTLALGLAGAALGSTIAVGAGTLAATGFLIGTTIGRIIEGSNVPDQTIQGPRLNDLRVMGSGFGGSIPRTYGQDRLAGELLWGKPIEEVEISEAVGGKGGKGGSVTNLSYEYFATFAVSFGEAPIQGITRLWANGKLVADYRSGGQTLDSAFVGRVRVNTGEETQLPDPAYQSFVGVDNASAYRGLCHVVFDRIPLAGMGPPIPNIEAEIVTAGTPSFPSTRASASQDLQPGSMFFSRTNRELYVGIHTGKLVKFDVAARVVVQEQPVGTLLEDMELGGDAVIGGDTGLDGAIYVGKNVTVSGNNSFINCYDADTLEKLYGTGVTVPDAITDIRVIFSPLAAILNPESVREKVFVTPRSNTHWSIVDTVPNGQGVLEVLETYEIDDYAVSGTGWTTSATHLVTVDDEQHVWMAWGSGSDMLLSRHEPGFGSVVESYVLAGKNTGTPLLGYDRQTNSIVVAGTTEFFTWSLDTHLIVSDTNGAFPHSLANNRSTFRNMPGNGKLWLDSGTTSFKEWSVDPLVEIRSILNLDWAGDAIQLLVYDIGSHAVIRKPTVSNELIWMDLDRETGAGVTLRSIVEDICSRVGLDPVTDVDAAGLTDIVLGYTITSRTTARSALAPLTNAYIMDGYESDGKARFRKRGSAAVATIGPDDLGAVDEGSESRSPLTETRRHEVALPQILDVRYKGAPEIDYTDMVQNVKRVQEAVTTVARRTMDLPIVLSDDEAKQIADKALYSAWIQRVSIALSTSQKFLALDPGDVIDVSPVVGTTFRILLMEADLGQNFVVRINALTEDAVAYISTLLGGAADGFVEQELSIVGPLAFAAMDINSPDDLWDALVVFQAANSRGTLFFPGAVVFGSDDGINFATDGQLIASDRGSIIGATQNALGSSDGHSWDRESSVTVRLSTGGSLSSATDLAVLNGANVCVIGQEILQFANATLNSDGTYTLDRFLRGLRGTEAESLAGHIAGQRFIMLSSSTTVSSAMDVASLAQKRYFSAMPLGGDVLSAITRSLTFEGRSIKPYSPVLIVGTIDTPATDDWTFIFSHRTRQGLENDWVDSVADIGNAESILQFEVDVLDTADDSVVATYNTTITANGSGVTVDATDSMNQKFVYDAADQVVDFGSAQATVKIRIYMMSATIGRGFPAEITVTG